MSLSIIPHDVLAAMLAVAESCPANSFAEVGVYRGGSAEALAPITRRKGVMLFLYDTFEGMPFADDDDKHRPGDFSDTSLEHVKRNIPDAIFRPGLFPNTLMDWPLGFVHCDVDQYRSTRSVVKYLWPLIVPGGAIWFDDVELEPAKRAIYELMPHDLLQEGPQGRLWARKPA